MKSHLASIRNQIRALLKDIKHMFGGPASPLRFVHEDVPYFSQWESRELAKDILEHKREAQDDPNWKSSGATTPEEYASWSWSGCGMACTKMILAHAQDNVVPFVTLGKQALKYGAYKLPLEEHPGLFYLPYVEFLQKEYGLTARIVTGLSVSEIIRALSEGSYVIASVTPEVRYPEQKPNKKSGHLILIVGYDSVKKKLYLHNPSGTNKSNQEYAEIGFKQFNKFFSHRGIVVSAKERF